MAAVEFGMTLKVILEFVEVIAGVAVSVLAVISLKTVISKLLGGK